MRRHLHRPHHHEQLRRVRRRVPSEWKRATCTNATTCTCLNNGTSLCDTTGDGWLCVYEGSDSSNCGGCNVTCAGPNVCENSAC